MEVVFAKYDYEVGVILPVYVMLLYEVSISDYKSSCAQT